MINILAVCSSAFYMNNCVSICELSPHVIGLQHIKHMRRQHLWFGNEYRCYREPCLLDVTTLISSVQFLSRVQLFMTPWTAAHQASLSITNSWSLLKLMSIESVMPSNRLILCCPILLTPLIFPSIRVFSSESALHIRWPKYWSFSFNAGPSSEHPGLISFRMDWLDLLAVQGTLRSLLNTTIQKHQFFGAQLSLWSNSHIHTWLLEKP